MPTGPFPSSVPSRIKLGLMSLSQTWQLQVRVQSLSSWPGKWKACRLVGFFQEIYSGGISVPSPNNMVPLLCQPDPPGDFCHVLLARVGQRALVRWEMWGRQSAFSLQTPPSTTSTSRLCPVPEIRAMAQSVQSAAEVFVKNAQSPTWPHS